MKYVTLSKKHLVSTMLALLAFVLCAPAVGQSELDDEAQRLVVMINGYWDNGETQGAGIVFGAQGGRLYIATANHVVRPQANNMEAVEEVDVEFFFRPGEVFPATVLRPLRSDLDLAVLTLPLEDTSIFPSQFPFHRFGDNFVLERADRIFTVGQGAGRPWNTLVGLANIFTNEDGMFDIQFDSVTEGDSGGALFTDSGELAGMILRSNPPAIEVLSVDLLKETLAEARYPLGEIAEAFDATASNASEPEVEPEQAAIGISVVSSSSDAPALALGEEQCNNQGLCLTLSNYYFTADSVAAEFEIVNKASSPLEVSYRNNAFRITDDRGQIYERIGTVDEKVETVPGGNSITLTPHTSSGWTSGFAYLPYFRGVVSEEATEIYVDVTDFMGITAKWTLMNLNPSAHSETLVNNEVIEIGNGYRANGLGVTLNNYSVSEGSVGLNFEVTNWSEHDILLRYRNTSFVVIDDMGRFYEHQATGNLKQQLLTAGESVFVNSHSSSGWTSGFEYLGVFEGVVPQDVTSLQVTINSFMGLENLAWKIFDVNPHSDETKNPNTLAPLALRETYTGAGLSVTLSNVELNNSRLLLSVVLRNESPSPILVRYRNDQLRVIDGDNSNLPHNGSENLKQRLLAPGEALEINSHTSAGWTSGFEYLSAFSLSETTDMSRMTVVFDEFMGLENLEWQFVPADL